MQLERKTQIFIPYSRKDKVFTRKLKAALEVESFDVWVDWEDIPPSANWMEEIAASIQGSDVERLVPNSGQRTGAGSLTESDWEFFFKQDEYRALCAGLP